MFVALRYYPRLFVNSDLAETKEDSLTSNFCYDGRMNYHNRFFTSVNNSGSGEVGASTIFHYRQKGDVVWATYQGGAIRQGTLVARVDDSGGLDMRYAHVNEAGVLMTGECRSTPELLPDGRIRLHEEWQWTSGDGSSGESIIEEVREGER